MKKILWIVIIYALIGTLVVNGQETLQLDEIRADEILQDLAGPSYQFMSEIDQTVEIEVRGVSGDFVPQLTLLQDNEALGVWYGVDTTSISIAITLQSDTLYDLNVSNTRRLPGQYTIIVRPVRRTERPEPEITVTEEAPPPPSTPNRDCVYTVKKGDNLFRISINHNRTLKQVMAANPQITNPRLIHAGNTIKIPGCVPQR